MIRSTTDETTAAAEPPAGGRGHSGSSLVQSSAKTFRIRWARLAIALVGAAALLTAPVTAVLAALGIVTGWVPVVSLLLAIASVVVLRTLAVRSRRRSPAQNHVPLARTAEPAPKARATVQRPTALFDGEDAGTEDAGTQENGTQENSVDGAAPEAETPANRYTAAELRAAALAVAAEAGDQQTVSAAPWSPVDVPKPTYVEAPKAERQEPAPLALPEPPKPQVKTPIKNSAVAPKVEAPSAPRLNLDDILQRRRA